MSSFLKWTGERMVPTVLNEIAVEHLARYAFCLSLVSGKKVLDVACGEGYGSYLLSNVAFQVIGLDIDKKTILHAIKKYNHSNLSFVRGNVLELPFPDGEFDAVISFETIEHLENQDQMLVELKRVMKKDGLLLISTPNKSVHSDQQAHDNKFHIKELDKKEFSILVEKNFRNIHFLNQQNLYGSIIYTDARVFSGADEVTGDYKHIKKEDKFAVPKYYLAVASDSELPAINAMFFNGANVYEERFIALKNTLTYKVGAFILYPFKQIKELIRRK